MKNPPKITIIKNGPYLVSGELPLAKEIMVQDRHGFPATYQPGQKYPLKESYDLCRCGRSSNKPYCDGTHIKINFDGTETASQEKYEKISQKIIGPELVLRDAKVLCWGAGFCYTHSGNTWEFTENSNDHQLKEKAIVSACHCPSGRLVVYDKKTGQSIEPKFKPALSLLEYPGEKASGPLWVKGGIEIESADSSKYEKRNRVCLCRCGQSANKPYCDGTHVDIQFSDHPD